MSEPLPLPRALLAGAVILGIDLLLLSLLHGEWERLILPNTWMILASVLVLRSRALPQLSPRRSHGLGIAALALALAVVVALAAWWPMGRLELGIPAAAKALLLVGAVPLAEELFFRGLLLPALAKRWGGVLATVLVSSLFAFLHSPQGLVLPMATLSLVLCALTLLTRTTLWAVGLHLAWNAAALVRDLAPGADRWLLVGGAGAALVALMAWGLASWREDAS